jgi:hypothetical protein
MAISLKHTFLNPKADGADATIARPSDWNAEHALLMATDKLLGRGTAGTGAAEEITIGSGLVLSGTTLNASGGVSGDANAFDSKAAVEAATIDAGIDVIHTAGYYAAGDHGGGMYVRIGSEPAHPGKIQSDDGAWWELVAEDAEVWVEQFGAIGSTDNNPDPSYDNWQHFEDAKTFIIAKRSIRVGGGFTLRVGVGIFYLSNHFEIKGAMFHLKGNGTGTPTYNGTTLRFPPGVDGIIVQRAYGIGHDIYAWSGNQEFLVGYKAWAGDNIYICTTAGTSHASVPPSGTGTGIVDGTVVWDFVRAATANEKTTVGGDGCVIEGMLLWSKWDFGSGVFTSHSGVLARARCRVRDVFAAAFAGCGFAFIANGDPDFPGVTGNVDNFYIGHCASYYNGMDGIHIGYSIANAGLAEFCDCSENGRWGVFDASFLGNTHIGHHVAFSGNYGTGGRKKYPGSVIHNGYQYQARLKCIGLETETVDYSNAPDTDDSSWFLVHIDGGKTPSDGLPEWSALETYEPGGAYASNNINARNVWIGCYSEGGGPGSIFQGSDLVLGGLHAAGLDTTATGSMLIDRGWNRPVSVGHNARTPGVTNFAYANLGPDNRPGQPFGHRGILAFGDQENDFNLTGLGPTDPNEEIDYVLRLNNSYDFLVITGDNTTRTYGLTGGATRSRAIVIPSLLVGPGSAARSIATAGATPSSGDWAQGDRAFEVFPTPGGHVGYICTAAGSPGTWAKYGNVLLENTATIDPANLAAGTVDTIQTMTVTGAALGDLVDVSFSLDLQGIDLRAWVSATNTVKYVFSCPAGGATVDLGSGTVKCRIRK